MHATAVTCFRGEEDEGDIGKENAPPKRHCHPQPHYPQTAFPTEEQRERIVHNFQAEKALLSRRRPRGLTVLPNNRNVSFEVAETVKTEAPSVPRVPLSSLDSSSSLETPSLHHATTNICSILDEEFDETFFREIDEICDQRFSMDEERIETGHTDPNEFLAVNIMESDCNEISCSQQRKGEKGSFPDCSTSSVPQNYTDYWNNLNDKQREAACSDIFIPLMIVAGPGSGKTSTMVGRVLMLLKEGIQPCNILALTFTTAAASEMRDRVGAVVGKALAKELAISTFHSFSLQLCRLHAEKLGRTADFLIYGHCQQRRAVIEALRLLENKKKDGENSENFSKSMVDSLKDKSKKWEKYVIQAKSSGRTPDECRKNGDDVGAVILYNYDEILRSCNALDYHDFISCSVKLTTEFPEVYKECQDKWKAIVVDEFQDTSLMQYNLLKNLASHNCITVIGDEDQSIFSFNGADISGFEFFRRDFQNYNEVRLVINYRSTRCIVEAASALIRNNTKRCHSKDVVTGNSSGSKITLKECHNEDAQCSFVADKILEITSNISATKSSFRDVAILYRRQITGKSFQVAFRDRKIPFNIHGVAFYRKKVIKAVISILKTTLSGCGDGPFRQSFKTLLLLDKEEKKRVIDHIGKISTSRECSFILAANDIFRAKVSGTFKRAQLSQGRKVLATLDMLSKLVEREKSISVVISSAAAMIPQKYLLEKRAVLNVDGGKYLNEEHDVRSVLQYLMDDVSEFLSACVSNDVTESDNRMEECGCSIALRAFLDYLLIRETENFQNRKHDNENSVTLTTIHQSKGLEWDTVFVVTVNESEIPLLHEFNGIIEEGGATLEEERRLFYVAMTRARKKLYVSYVLMDPYWQLQQPSRFLKEIPSHLLDGQETEVITKCWNDNSFGHSDSISHSVQNALVHEVLLENVSVCGSHVKDAQLLNDDLAASSESCFSNSFLRRFSIEDRSVVSHIFHQWARKAAFQNPTRLLGKIGYVIDERLRNKNCKNKDLLRALKLSLDGNEASQYAQQILKWEQIPFEKRSHLMREKQEHFQKQRMMKSMGTSDATSKQIVYLQMLGCAIVPTSRLHASNLIEQYKTL